MRANRHTGVAGVFAAVYVLLVLYASLYPFAGWRDNGTPVTAFLFAAWPRYWSWFDLVTNVLGYMPLGFLCVAVLQTRHSPWLAAVMVVAFGGGLSLSMETLQNFLPTRVSSNVDLGCNALGTLLGALTGVRWGGALLEGGNINTLRARLIVPGKAGDYGLLLLAFWLLAQLNIETLLFGTGDLRRLLDLPPSLPFSAERFIWLEAFIAGAAAVAVGLVGALLLQTQRLALLAILLLLTLAVRMLAVAILIDPAEFAHWLTPGNSLGVAVGSVVVGAAAWLPRRIQRSLAALALLLATVLVNLAPENPYLANAPITWPQGHFLNFNGLTRLASSLWPFVTLPWLMLAGPPRRRVGR